jgi:hypothetical protein
MKTIAQRLKEQQARSDEFTRKSFGLPIGDGYMELVREITGNTDLARKMAIAGVLNLFALRVNVLASSAEAAAASPNIYSIPLEHLYWGIEIGREMEREQAAVLIAEGKTA